MGCANARLGARHCCAAAIAQGFAPISREPNGVPARIYAMRPAKILIVEDEFLVAANLEAALEDWGHTSLGIAPDVSAALQLAAQAPDVALVDVNLRDGQTGPTIAKKLREMGVSVLFVTANPRMLEGVAKGAIGVLTKPCDEELMRAAIAYALNVRLGIALPAPPGLTLISDA